MRLSLWAFEFISTICFFKISERQLRRTGRSLVLAICLSLAVEERVLSHCATHCPIRFSSRLPYVLGQVIALAPAFRAILRLMAGAPPSLVTFLMPSRADAWQWACAWPHLRTISSGTWSKAALGKFMQRGDSFRLVSKSLDLGSPLRQPPWMQRSGIHLFGPFLRLPASHLAPAFTSAPVATLMRMAWLKTGKVS